MAKKKWEAQFLTKVFRPWIHVNGHRLQSGPIEAKHCRGKDSISFSAVEKHQRNALLACTSTKGYYHKISDMSAEIKGCDSFFYRNAPAYLVFAYTKKFYIISIHNFLHEDKISKRRSLTEQRASEICILSNPYKCG